MSLTLGGKQHEAKISEDYPRPTDNLHPRPFKGYSVACTRTGLPANLSSATRDLPVLFWLLLNRSTRVHAKREQAALIVRQCGPDPRRPSNFIAEGPIGKVGPQRSAGYHPCRSLMATPHWRRAGLDSPLKVASASG